MFGNVFVLGTFFWVFFIFEAVFKIAVEVNYHSRSLPTELFCSKVIYVKTSIEHNLLVIFPLVIQKCKQVIHFVHIYVNY